MKRLLQNLQGRHGGRPSGKRTGIFRKFLEGRAPSCPHEREVLQEPDEDLSFYTNAMQTTEKCESTAYNQLSGWISFCFMVSVVNYLVLVKRSIASAASGCPPAAARRYQRTAF